jgi:hypothetical protein
MDPITMSLLASAGSGLITKLMNPGGGYKAGQKKLDQGYNAAQGYMQPYQENGQEAYGNLSGAMNDLLNPSSLMDRWMNDYQQSEQSKIAQARAMEQGNRAASSTGVLGSTPHLQAMQAGANEIGAQDEQRYIDRMIQQYLQGAGLAQNIYGVGANTAGNMGQNAMNYANQSADLAYGAKAAPGQMFGNLLGTAANVGGAYMGANAMNNMANAWKTAGANNSAMPAYMGGNGYSAGGF